MTWELVKKDITFLVSSLKSTLLVMIVFPLVLPMCGLGFGIAMPAMICYMGVYGILAYEEKSKMHLLNMTLPVTRREICFAKYIYAFIITVFSSILSCVGIFLGNMIQGQIEGYLLMQQLPLYSVMMLAGGIIYVAISLPCIFYWGTIKSRYVLMGLYIMTFVLASNIQFGAIDGVSTYLNDFLAGHTTGFIVFITCIALAVSIGVSLKIWEKKDMN